MGRGLHLLPEPRRLVLEEALGRLPPGRYPVEFDPPPVPAGRVAGLPDFIGVGAQRAGTSWWYRLLTSQPAIHHERGWRKEKHFFNRFYDSTPSDADLARYRNWFPRPTGKLAGEWTPCYMHHFWVPPLIARTAPDAKVLVLLRDPVDRYRSGLTHEMQYGGLPRFVYVDDALARGMYATQLERLRAAVPAANILVLQYERCRVDTAGQLRRTLEFLGVEDEPQAVERSVNVTLGPKVGLPPGVHEELVCRYAPEARRLATMVPDLDLDLWPSVAGTS